MEDEDKFSSLLELYEKVKRQNVWTPQNLESLQDILGDTHPLEESIKLLFEEANNASGYGPAASAQMTKLSETIIQSLPGKVGRFKREYTQRYNALNRTTAPTQLTKLKPDFVEKRPGSAVTRFYRSLKDSQIETSAKAKYGPSATVLQYRISRGLKPKTQTSGQFIKTIQNIVDNVTGDEFSFRVLGVIEDVDRVNTGHVVVVL